MAPAWVLVLVLVGLSAGTVDGQGFDPGCSFSNGQCIYNVKLGHEQQCDSPKRFVTDSNNAGSNSGSTTDFQSCSCKDVAATNHNVDALYSSMATLQGNFDQLAQKLNVTQQQLGMKTDEINSLFSNNQNITALLASKESLLNKSKVELANTVAAMNKDLDSLRRQLTDTNNQLHVCQAGVGGGSGNTGPDPVLYSNFVTHYCDFETTHFCNYTLDTNCHTSGHECWKYGTGRQNTVSGPVEDHTFGSPKGHYMYIDPLNNPTYSSSSSSSYHHAERKARIISPEFPPARHYCVRFWYTMYGIDIQTLSVYARVGSGDGYPVFQLTGQQDKYWHMAQIQLSSEYTANPFRIVLEGETNSYWAYRSGSHKDYYKTHGYIAFDDVFVYNTTCRDIPTCPANSHKRTVGNATSCYTVHVAPASWYDAVKTCKMEAPNGHLVTVDSKLEQEFLVDMLQNDAAYVAAGADGFFTSGNDERTEANFKWTDTGFPYSVNYTDWAPGQPNNVGNVQNCLLLENQYDDYTWGDVNCADKHPYICEIKQE